MAMWMAIALNKPYLSTLQQLRSVTSHKYARRYSNLIASSVSFIPSLFISIIKAKKYNIYIEIKDKRLAGFINVFGIHNI